MTTTGSATNQTTAPDEGKTTNMFELHGVTKFFDKGGQVVRALDGVDLTIGDGEFLAIQGPTGQGKSTLLQLLGGLDRPTSGEVKFDGVDLAQLAESGLSALRASAFGFVFQTFNLIPTLTAQENVETALVPLHERTGDRRRKARQALDELGLGDRASHLPSELSGGQQQRVAIARALVKNPKVLLADEPTGNLDEQTRDEIVALLETLWRDRGLTMVLVTHDSAVARRAGRIAVIRGGRVSLSKVRSVPVG
jgi:putative ABC transport system ATP-binding protein